MNTRSEMNRFLEAMANSLNLSLNCKLSDVMLLIRFVTNALRNKNNVNPAITITNLLKTNINNRKLTDVSYLESFNATLTPI